MWTRIKSRDGDALTPNQGYFNASRITIVVFASEVTDLHHSLSTHELPLSSSACSGDSGFWDVDVVTRFQAGTLVCWLWLLSSAENTSSGFWEACSSFLSPHHRSLGQFLHPIKNFLTWNILSGSSIPCAGYIRANCLHACGSSELHRCGFQSKVMFWRLEIEHQSIFFSQRTSFLKKNKTPCIRMNLHWIRSEFALDICMCACIYIYVCLCLCRDTCFLSLLVTHSGTDRPKWRTEHNSPWFLSPPKLSWFWFATQGNDIISFVWVMTGIRRENTWSTALKILPESKTTFRLGCCSACLIWWVCVYRKFKPDCDRWNQRFVLFAKCRALGGHWGPNFFRVSFKPMHLSESNAE